MTKIIQYVNGKTSFDISKEKAKRLACDIDNLNEDLDVQFCFGFKHVNGDLWFRFDSCNLIWNKDGVTLTSEKNYKSTCNSSENSFGKNLSLSFGYQIDENDDCLIDIEHKYLNEYPARINIKGFNNLR